MNLDQWFALREQHLAEGRANHERQHIEYLLRLARALIKIRDAAPNTWQAEIAANALDDDWLRPYISHLDDES